MEDSPASFQSTAILKELSDIKSSLAINTTETANIKGTISEVKADIKDIKNDFTSRREFLELQKEAGVTKSDVENLKEFKWKLIGIVIASSVFASFIGQYILKGILK